MPKGLPHIIISGGAIYKIKMFYGRVVYFVQFVSKTLSILQFLDILVAVHVSGFTDISHEVILSNNNKTIQTEIKEDLMCYT